MVKNPYLDSLKRTTPQVEQADPRQTKNNAGGFTFVVSDQSRLERFLILGTTGGSYYATEQDLTKQNVDFLVDLIKRDGWNFVQTVVAVSTQGRAAKQSPALFALALVFKHGNKEAKGLAQFFFPKVVRTSTHLFEFSSYIKFLGGWGRAKRSIIADWYTSKDPAQLAYQAVKYRQRGGWTHRDLFRLSHPKGVNKYLGNFILGKPGIVATEDSAFDIIKGFNFAQVQTTVPGIVSILQQYPNLPWEALPTQFLKNPEVWKQLFYNGALSGQALVRNITRLARIGAFADLVFAVDYAAKLTDEEMIRKTRLHPINYLNALVVHTKGQIDRKGGIYAHRKHDWTTVPQIVDALNEGFHLSFKSVEKANKRTMLALDISSSMTTAFSGSLDLTASEVSGAMAMVTARTEPYYMVRGFAHELRELPISAKMDLNQVMNTIHGLSFGSTNCALPMVWAMRNKVEIDTFCVYTDNETWAGVVHPHTALQEYRNKMGIDAKLVVVGVTATESTIADPTDRGMLDVVGFDSNAPKVIADFSAGRI